MAYTVVPFGPQHPVLPEPVHLQLTLEDEKVVEAIPALGYVHRGLEMLVAKRDFNQMIYVVERVCGICSCIHAMCYCEAIEKLMNIEVPPRAKYLRVVFSELHRIHSHLLWLGLVADAFGFESLFMQFWKLRERFMDIYEATAGNRVILSVNVVGGVRRDLSADHVKWIYRELEELEKNMRRLKPVMMDDYTVKARMVGKGVLSGEQALQLGAVGPVLRGSGVAEDARLLGYEALADLHYEPVTMPEGDSWARSMVRFLETLQAADLVRQALDKLPDSELAAKVKGNPEGEAICRVEQPRGEMFSYLKGDGTNFLARCRIRTPTFANIPPLLA
ncbi:MAG: nickel-dependent hydrogenase large subunit, partial [Deltaproteobacteria bacterium]|nr:nickel-dependent hydrogenase large subunit [Deltaproteobacteria bacterium]